MYISTSVFILIIGGLAILGFASSIAAFKKGYRDGYDRGREQGRKEAGTSLMDAHYWFSHHPMTCNTLFIIAKYLKRFGYFNVSEVRHKVTELGEQRYDNLSPDEIDQL